MNVPADPGPIPTGEELRGKLRETFERIHGPLPRPSVLPLLPPPARPRADYHPSLSGFGREREGAAGKPAASEAGPEVLLAGVIGQLLPHLREQLLDVLAEDIGELIRDVLRDRGL